MLVRQERKTNEWPADMMLPCRGCTSKNDGVEVRKPLQAFAVCSKVFRSS